MDPVEFRGCISKVVTLADKGVRCSFDLSDPSVEPAAILMAFFQAGVAVRVCVIPITIEKLGTDTSNMQNKLEANGESKLGKGKKWESSR